MYKYCIYFISVSIYNVRMPCSSPPPCAYSASSGLLFPERRWIINGVRLIMYMYVYDVFLKHGFPSV